MSKGGCREYQIMGVAMDLTEGDTYFATLQYRAQNPQHRPAAGAATISKWPAGQIVWVRWGWDSARPPAYY
jgi:hypothetical protein